MPHNLSKGASQISERTSKTEGGGRDHGDKKRRRIRETCLRNRDWPRVAYRWRNAITNKVAQYTHLVDRFSRVPFAAFSQGFHLVIATLSSLVCTNFARRFSLCSCDLETKVSRGISSVSMRVRSQRSRIDIVPILSPLCRERDRSLLFPVVSSLVCSSLLINL